MNMNPIVHSFTRPWGREGGEDNETWRERGGGGGREGTTKKEEEEKRKGEEEGGRGEKETGKKRKRAPGGERNEGRKREGSKRCDVVELTNGGVAEVEPVYTKHSKEKRESNCHTIIVAWPLSTQLPV